MWMMIMMKCWNSLSRREGCSSAPGMVSLREPDATSIPSPYKAKDSVSGAKGEVGKQDKGIAMGHDPSAPGLDTSASLSNPVTRKPNSASIQVATTLAVAPEESDKG
ncbi:hypothetical protein GOP47_0028718 [Adiantum capillus-veneris]|nr:hypothetical protein GOP47_0028718 [Adiantum capillus-veneris]